MGWGPRSGSRGLTPPFFKVGTLQWEYQEIAIADCLTGAQAVGVDSHLPSRQWPAGLSPLSPFLQCTSTPPCPIQSCSDPVPGMCGGANFLAASLNREQTRIPRRSTRFKYRFKDVIMETNEFGVPCSHSAVLSQPHKPTLRRQQSTCHPLVVMRTKSTCIDLDFQQITIPISVQSPGSKLCCLGISRATLTLVEGILGHGLCRCRSRLKMGPA